MEDAENGSLTWCLEDMKKQPQKKRIDKRAVLYFLEGVGAGEAIKLRRDATIFGREKADVVISDSEVSSSHCQIQSIDGVYHIFDMNSTNGTYVNRERIVKSKLAHGDEIMIGKTVFRFALEDDNKVKHISTLFKISHKGNEDKLSLVDTLIESEMNSTQSSALVFYVTYFDGSVETIELNQKLVYIGRASSFGRFDQDTEISRKHLLVKLNDQGEVFIEDQGSTNGSFLNGRKIKGMHLVQEKDVITVGTTQLRIAAKTG